MISLSPETVFVFLALFMLLAVVALWLIESFRDSPRRLKVARLKVVRCRKCSFHMVSHGLESVWRCERCNTLNGVNSKLKV